MSGAAFAPGGLAPGAFGFEPSAAGSGAFAAATPLAIGRQIVKSRDGNSRTNDFVDIWINQYGPKKTRVFSTTIGHNNETVADARYLDLVTRGLLWACDKLDDSHLKPTAK